MYISISAQTLGNNFSQSVSDFVDYLEKENQGLVIEEREHFFNQYGDEFSVKEVIKDIDGNTAKLKKKEPKFYSITVSPSQRELRQLQNSSKYYERFFELIKMKTTSINKGHNLNFDTRVTKGEKEVSKVRADIFFKLKPGEFISFADGNDKRVQFKLQKIIKNLPKTKKYSKKDLKRNFKRIHREAQSLFGK